MTSNGIDRRAPLAEQVYEVLRSDIVSGALPPHAQLSEPDLAERLQVSRTPLRLALARLSDEGLVVIYPQFGSFVAPIRLDAVAEAQFVREHLECALIRDAAARIDAPMLRTLRNNLDRQARALRDGDLEEFYALDEALHAAFAEAGGHAGVWKLIQHGKVHMDRVRHLSLSIDEHPSLLLEQHAAIVDALAAGNANAAEAALRVHLREVFATVQALGLEEFCAPAMPKRRRRASAAAPGADR
ncbi:MAG TPA: GntR family transcriptional regulator [Azospirillum sp.]|nr:GntR family transcriptional regulator [Azospirillum sp.]